MLAVDADPDSNLPYALGMTDDKTLSTIGRTRQDFFDSKGDVPAGMPKEAFLELKLNQSLVEAKDVDLVVMGRPEGRAATAILIMCCESTLRYLARTTRM